MSSNNYKHMNINIKESIATVTFNMQSAKANKLSFEFLDELSNLVDEINSNSQILAVVFQSAKKKIFIAGADINEIKEFRDEESAYNMLIKGDDILTKVENIKVPTIAYVHGACMGGGLEFALCCKYIIATTNAETKIAFPEVKLGFFPGLGGTQRFPKRVGLVKSLELILSGKTIDAKKAYRMNLADKIFDNGQKEFMLKDFLTDILGDCYEKRDLPLSQKAMEKFSVSRNYIFKKSLESIEKKVNKDFKAPYVALDVLKQTYNMPFDEGIKIEARAFAKLAITKESKYLIDIFFMFEGVKKSFEKTNVPLKNSLVLGNGVMGKGIIWLFTKYLDEVRIKLRDVKQAKKVFDDVYKIYEFLIKIRKMTPKQVALKMSKLSYTQNFDGIHNTDIALEAIIEDEKAKKDIFKNLEKNLKKDAIIATNTSSISIEKLGNELKNKKNFLGVHFFNPVNKMPLVEVIPTQHTSKKTLNRVMELLVTCGKTPVIVGDCAGFVVNRILLPYINEAGFILEKGSGIKEIDKTLKDFGMPMGPFTLGDTVGIDIGFHVATILNESYGERMPIASILKDVYDLKIFGVKTKKGFYDYSKKDKKVNDDIEKLQKSKKDISKEEIVQRCIYIMINEASRILEEKIVNDAKTVDLAMIAGTGFPPYKGGLLRYADEMGINHIVQKLHDYEEVHGIRFKPSDLLLKMKKEKLKFYQTT